MTLGVTTNTPDDLTAVLTLGLLRLLEAPRRWFCAISNSVVPAVLPGITLLNSVSVIGAPVWALILACLP